MQPETILKKLNAKQQEAVTTTTGPVLVVAGPGSGKTRLLTHRIAYLIATGVQPENILAVTFTNKAANEMRERVKKIVGQKNSSHIGTFHSICGRILRAEIEQLGYSPNFSVYGTEDQLGLIKKVMEAQHIDSKQFHPRAILGKISNLKNELITAEKQAETNLDFFGHVVNQVYNQYQKELRQNQALDFDDMIMLTVEIFEKYPDVLKRYQNTFKYLMIDEFQDTNKANYTFVRLIARAHNNILVVGDDAQGIFSWRGADIRNILTFERDYPQAKVITLDQNYRSTQAIIRAASVLIANNDNQIKKELWTENDSGDQIFIQQAADERQEGRFIIKTIKKLQEDGLNPRQIAILYRTHAQSRYLEEALLRAGLPYKIARGTAFYERREIKDVLAYLKIIANPFDLIAFSRIYNIPARGIGKATLNKLMGDYENETSILDHLDKNLAKLGAGPAKKVAGLIETFRSVDALRAEVNVSELVRKLLKKIDYAGYIRDGSNEGEDRWENIREIFSVLKKFDGQPTPEGLRQFLEEVALVQDSDAIDEDENQITLMTFHAAKGLEFPAVFMVGMEEGVFPHSRSLINRQELEEERRLCYVGITRAEKNLFLTYCKKRTLYGTTQLNLPSRFIFEIPENIVHHTLSEPDVDLGLSDTSSYDDVINY